MNKVLKSLCTGAGSAGAGGSANPAAARPPAARKPWADEEDDETLGPRKTPDPPEERRRPLAPEERCAQTEAQAAALEGSAASLRQHGLAERAAELEAEAAQLRKRTPAPAPGRRLDQAEGYLRRCQGRAAKSAEATAAAEEELRKAKLLQATAEKDAREADEQLQKLRKDLAGGADAAMPDAGAQEASGTAEAELADLRALLRRTEEERDAAHLAAGRAPPEPQAALMTDLSHSDQF